MSLLPSVDAPNSAVKKRRICVLGARSVGKSALVSQFVDGTFVEQYYPTIENVLTKSARHKNQEYELEIIDTAGQDEYSMLSSRYAIGIHGFILVFSVASRPSYELIKAVHQKILAYHGIDSVPCVIVGQKADLVELGKAQRQVEKVEALDMANEMHAVFVETSAEANRNISEAFDRLFEEMDKMYNPQPDKPPATWNSKCVIM